MAFYPIYHYRLYDNPVDRFFGDQLDFFDPYHDLNTSPTALVMIPNNFKWVNKPKNSANESSHGQMTDKNTTKAANTEKFRIQLNVAGFNPETVKTKVEGGKVVVEAKQEERQPDGDYNIREVRKSFPLPELADASQLTSFVTPNKILVIEVPIRNPEVERRLAEAQKKNEALAQFGQHRDPRFDYHNFLHGSDFQSKIVDKGNNEKELEMSIEMKNYKPNEIKVQVKNNELIVKGERRHQDGNSFEQSFFMKSTALPPGTQVEQLQSHMTDDGHLTILAPYIERRQATPLAEHNTTTEPIEHMDTSKHTQNQENMQPTGHKAAA